MSKCSLRRFKGAFPFSSDSFVTRTLKTRAKPSIAPRGRCFFVVVFFFLSLFSLGSSVHPSTLVRTSKTIKKKKKEFQYEPLWSCYLLRLLTIPRWKLIDWKLFHDSMSQESIFLGWGGGVPSHGRDMYTSKTIKTFKSYMFYFYPLCRWPPLDFLSFLNMRGTGPCDGFLTVSPPDARHQNCSPSESTTGRSEWKFLSSASTFESVLTGSLLCKRRKKKSFGHTSKLASEL